MRVTIKDLGGFERSVFGADCFLRNFPELKTEVGVEVKKMFHDGHYFIINPETGRYYDRSTFFTKDDLKFLKKKRKSRGKQQI